MDYIGIDKIKPASYNPRHLSEAAYQELKGSISALGFILPIIVNRDNMTIVAGHQRTKACKALGIDEVPVFYVGDVTIQDEIRFNQVHNGIEIEPDVKGTYDCQFETGLTECVPQGSFTVTEHKAAVTENICDMIVRYGNVLCAILCDGKVVFGNNYIKACQILNIPVNISVVEAGMYGILNYYLFQDYGVFCYENIERQDFVQGLAQPQRHKSMDWSVLYREVVKYVFKEPKSISILDFGCGKGRFINKLKMECGYNRAIGLEFFNHNRKGVDIKRGHVMIDRFIQHVKKHGKFDYVICDAVINSVNTQHAEDSVLACLSLFCKPGGKIFVSGRRREALENSVMNAKHVGKIDSVRVRYFDKDGLTSEMREGQWFFQKFLYDNQVTDIIHKFDDEPFMRYNESYFGFGVLNNKEWPVEQLVDAVCYEFNLKLPYGQSYGRQDEILDLFGLPKKTS